MKSVSVVGDVSDVSGAVEKPSKSKGKARKYLVRGAVVLAVALGLGQLLYTLSGDDKWVYVGQTEGVQVYEMKVPGRNVKKFMGVFHLKGTLSQVVAFITDQHMNAGDGGFTDSRLLNTEGPQVWWQYWKTRLPAPMKTRDYVVKHMVTQDPQTKEVVYALTAKPYMIPLDKCCERVLKMDNSWRFTPISSNEMEVHWVLDMNIGGWAPYFLVNKWFNWEVPNLGSGIQEAVSRKKYVGAKLDWIQDF